MKKNYFYFMSKDLYFICDLEFCSEGGRTYDMSFYDLANNEKLLAVLHLYYIYGSYGVRYNHTTRAEWFTSYISAFHESKEDEGMHEKLLTNPKVRLYIMDEELFSTVDELIKSDVTITKGKEPTKAERDYELGLYNMKEKKRKEREEKYYHKL